MKRAVVVVLDACGVGALPDAAEYGDAGSSTLEHVAQLVGGLTLPNLGRLGLGMITPLQGVEPAGAGGAQVLGRLAAIGPGKDSTAGHWALMGVAAADPLPTYPQGFPEEVIELITTLSGRAVLCNRPYDGVDAIRDFADEHLRSGALIVYTSQDSVLQIAAHEAVYATAVLHELCRTLRARLPAEHAVGRVIARPFRGAPGSLERTAGRLDLAIDPPAESYLDALCGDGIAVHSVGKAGALFAGRGVSEQHPAPDNATAIRATTALLGELQAGLVFTNLIETDQVYGHRHDVNGFAAALQQIDAAVGEWLALLRKDDLLILTADHGVDPAVAHTDHTREYVPLLAITGAGQAIATAGQASAAGTGSGPDPAGRAGRRHDGPMSDVGATVFKWLTGRPHPTLPGSAFL